MAVEKKIKAYSIRITFQGPNVITVCQYDFFPRKFYQFDATCLYAKHSSYVILCHSVPSSFLSIHENNMETHKSNCLKSKGIESQCRCLNDVANEN